MRNKPKKPTLLVYNDNGSLYFNIPGSLRKISECYWLSNEIDGLPNLKYVIAIVTFHADCKPNHTQCLVNVWLANEFIENSGGHIP